MPSLRAASDAANNAPGAALVGAGFADFPLVAYHVQKTGLASETVVTGVVPEVDVHDLTGLVVVDHVRLDAVAEIAAARGCRSGHDRRGRGRRRRGCVGIYMMRLGGYDGCVDRDSS